MKTRTGEKIKVATIEELLGVQNEETASEIPVDRIYDFEGHPFKVLDDEKMEDLVESIKKEGVLTPVLVRPDKDGDYEMISGHRRLHAAKLAGLFVIPAIVREMNDEDAVIAMVDANIQREEILPSERAFAFKMKLNAIKRKAGRPKKENLSQNGTNKRSDQIIAEETGISRNQVQRYIRLTELVPGLLDLVDEKKLQFMVAVDCSYMDSDVQEWLCEYINENGPIKPNQIAALKERLEKENMTQSKLISTLNKSRIGAKPANKVSFTEKKLRRYFPAEYSTSDMENIITHLLEEWCANNDVEGDE